MKTGIEKYGSGKLQAKGHSVHFPKGPLNFPSIGGPSSQIEVVGDQQPTTLTLVTAVTVHGDPGLYAAYGEQAGMNLVDAIEADPNRSIVLVVEVDESTLAASSIYRRSF